MAKAYVSRARHVRALLRGETALRVVLIRKSPVERGFFDL
jgi:hypothetical protein